MEPPYPTRITRPPGFADEEWLRQAIHELNTRPMISEERFHFARMVAKNAEVIHAEMRMLQEVKEAEKLAVKTEIVKNALEMGLTVEQTAKVVDVYVEFVQNIQREIKEA